ncbi:sugar transporter [Marinithermofilum abyssi]|uniref:Sugar transporter n=1 Tax=Marinithermofilum abyssi TaxID=1571185 RepID=A0A8J2YD41_9BACL|nr:polysaccharide biosynthesis protein [Marinithermofilum abyssi]GGE21784.1 sugar transporter [Marinithermofilum abyssi]
MTQAKQSFVKGAAILGIATLFTKILGAVYRVPYQNITGNEGMFVYQQVYPLYSTLLILATAGFPIAISKLVSERLAAGDPGGARRVFRITAVLLTVTGLIFFILLYMGASRIAEWMGSREMLTMPIQSVSFALLIVPVLSAIRGYFQGYQNMTPTAVSQVVEQIIRVATILLLSWWFMENGAGVVYAGAGAVFGAFTGALGALAVLIYYWRKNLGLERQIGTASSDARGVEESVTGIIHQLMMLAIPICLGSLVMPLFSLVDSFTIANLLTAGGWSVDQAIDAKGVFDRGQPLIQFASFFATALALSIVPAIADAKIRGDERTARERAGLALRLTLLIGVPASVGLAIIAEPTNVMLFEDSDGSDALAILAFTSLFSTMGMTSGGILQGFGRVVLPARNLLIGVVVKLLLNQWWIPLWDIRGAALATVAGYAVAAWLNLRVLREETGYLFGLRGKGPSLILATLFMSGIVWLTVKGLHLLLTGDWPLRLEMAVVALASVMTGALAYLTALFRLRVLIRSDVEQLPKGKEKMIRMLDRFRLLPK